MKVNVKQELLHIDGKTPLRTEVAPGVTETMTIGNALLGALLMTEQDETPTAKVQAYQIAQKVSKALASEAISGAISGLSFVELSSEDVVLAKAKAGRLYGPLVYGQLVEILI